MIPILFIISRRYVNLANCLNIRHLIISPHFLQQVQYVNLINCLRPLIWSSHPILSSQYVNLVDYFKTTRLYSNHPIILFIHFQMGRSVSVVGQLFFQASHVIISSHPLQVVREVNCLNSPYLIFLSLHLSPERTWTMSIVLRPLIWLFHPSVSR